MLLLILRRWFHSPLLLASSALSSTFFRLFLHPRYSTLSLFSPAPRAAALRSDARWCSSCCWPLPKKENRKKKRSTTQLPSSRRSVAASHLDYSLTFSQFFLFSLPLSALRFCVENDGHLLARWKRDKIISRLLRIHHDDDNGPRMDEKASWIEYIFFSTSLSSLRSALVAAVWHNRENEKSHRRRLLSRCCSDFESIKKLTS